MKVVSGFYLQTSPLRDLVGIGTWWSFESISKTLIVVSFGTLSLSIASSNFVCYFVVNLGLYPSMNCKLSLFRV